MQTRHRNRWVASALISLCFMLCACSSEPKPPDNRPDESATQDSNSAGSRDATPQVLVPEAGGTDIRQCDVATIDASNASEGYIMADYTGDSSKVKLQICGPDAVTYTYNLHGGYEVFPLTAGSGNYTIGVYENISGNQYATALNEQMTITIKNEFGPYLYPNQYVNFTAQSQVVNKAQALAASADSDIDVVTSVYNYIIDNISYDYDKAKSVTSGYLPDVDTVLSSQKGICFDYAAVMTAMLRSQRIPTRLEVGYMGDVYHAWISIYTKETGWVNGIIKFNGKNWELMDPTFASTSKSPKNFTSENSKYTTKYVY